MRRRCTWVGQVRKPAYRSSVGARLDDSDIVYWSHLTSSYGIGRPARHWIAMLSTALHNGARAVAGHDQMLSMLMQVRYIAAYLMDLRCRWRVSVWEI